MYRFFNTLCFIESYLSSYDHSRLSFASISNTEVTKLRIMENKRAVQKFFTSKPSTSLSVIKIIMVLMTSKNKPKVSSVIGKVKKTSIGFTMAFRKARTAATITAIIMFSTYTPGRIFETISIASVEMINLLMKLIRCSLTKNEFQK